MTGRPVIVAARRTPVGTAGHALAGVTVDGLAAPVLAALAADLPAHSASEAYADDAGRTTDTPAIDDVLLGNCLGPGGNIARIAALRAGLGVAVPGVTVDRQCGSGLDAILQGAARIAAGEARLVIAGGAESASTAPWRSWPPTAGADPQRYTRAPFAPAGYPDPEMGPAAEAVAAHLGISREQQDEWAARSFARTLQSQRTGVFDAELVPVNDLDDDERPRSGMTTERLARLPAAFVPGGTVTAGNSCGISDGAAAVTLTSDPGDRPGIEVLGGSVRGCDPALPGVGPAAAVPPLLARHGLTVDDIGAVEITEAFAAQLLAAVDCLRLDPDTVCADGGAIAMGHPWGASGALLVVRLFHRMLAPGGPEFGLASCAVGGGQGIAVLFRRVGRAPRPSVAS
jgi:acetyl-CoA C-acetyltransferase